MCDPETAVVPTSEAEVCDHPVDAFIMEGENEAGDNAPTYQQVYKWLSERQSQLPFWQGEDFPWNPSAFSQKVSELRKTYATDDEMADILRRLEIIDMMFNRGLNWEPAKEFWTQMQAVRS